METLKFHTSRGGRFLNSGYITFEGFENILDNIDRDYIYDKDDITEANRILNEYYPEYL